MGESYKYTTLNNISVYMEDEEGVSNVKTGSIVHSIEDLWIQFNYNIESNNGSFDIFPIVNLDSEKLVIQCSLFNPQFIDYCNDDIAFINLLYEIANRVESFENDKEKTLYWNDIKVGFRIKLIDGKLFLKTFSDKRICAEVEIDLNNLTQVTPVIYSTDISVEYIDSNEIQKGKVNIIKIN